MEKLLSKNRFKETEKHRNCPEKNDQNSKGKAEREHNPGNLRKNLNYNLHLATSKRKNRPDKTNKDKNEKNHNQRSASKLNVIREPRPENSKVSITENKVPNALSKVKNPLNKSLENVDKITYFPNLL